MAFADLPPETFPLMPDNLYLASHIICYCLTQSTPYTSLIYLADKILQNHLLQSLASSNLLAYWGFLQDQLRRLFLQYCEKSPIPVLPGQKKHPAQPTIVLFFEPAFFLVHSCAIFLFVVIVVCCYHCLVGRGSIPIIKPLTY